MQNPNKATTNLFLDIAIFLALILAMAPHATGVPVHEWLSIAFAAAIVAHILLHWEWLLEVAPKIFTRLFHGPRLNFAVDLAFFLLLILIMVSGFAISKVALPAIGISPPFSLVWKQVHHFSALGALITLGIHCGLHASWLALNAKRCIFGPIARLLRRQSAETIATEGK